MLNNIKRYLLSYFSGVTTFTPHIYLSDANFAQNPYFANTWKALNIGLIINVTSDDPITPEIKKLYKQLGIDYLAAPIKDNNEPLPKNYLERILLYVMNYKPTNILIHCSAGVNRSALVAGALLWYMTNPK